MVQNLKPVEWYILTRNMENLPQTTYDILHLKCEHTENIM